MYLIRHQWGYSVCNKIGTVFGMMKGNHSEWLKYHGIDPKLSNRRCLPI